MVPREVMAGAGIAAGAPLPLVKKELSPVLFSPTRKVVLRKGISPSVKPR
jgi:hypothetical protein